MITVVLIISIVVFIVTCLFPGLMISNVVLAGQSNKNRSLIGRYVTAGALSLFTGVSCTIAFFILVPLAIVGAVLVFALLVVSEIIGMLNGR